MPRTPYRLKCANCEMLFTAFCIHKKYCDVCKNASSPDGSYGQRYQLVACADILDEGMIGRKNTIKIWLQLRVSGAVVRTEGECPTWYAYDGKEFHPYYANPQPKFRFTGKREARSAKPAETFQITAGGAA